MSNLDFNKMWDGKETYKDQLPKQLVDFIKNYKKEIKNAQKKNEEKLKGFHDGDKEKDKDLDNSLMVPAQRKRSNSFGKLGKFFG